ncbi:MAG: hypothetical protein R2711_09885 [Acidimicrobiales bacterium]
MKLTIDLAATDGGGLHRDDRHRPRRPAHAAVHAGRHPGLGQGARRGDLERLGITLILGNTYHLMLRPRPTSKSPTWAASTRFMDWSGHVLTDSGGFRIFSLEPKVDDVRPSDPPTTARPTT